MSEKEDALYLQNEFNNMKAANYFETANGVIYFEPQGTKIVFGGATNAGIIPEYEFDYDFTQSLDWNLQGMIEQVFEAEGYPEFDEAKILLNTRSNKMLKRNEAEEVSSSLGTSNLNNNIRNYTSSCFFPWKYLVVKVFFFTFAVESFWDSSFYD